MDKDANAISAYLVDLRNALRKGIDSIIEMGQIYVKAIDEDPENAKRIADEFASVIPRAAWRRYEEVGRGLHDHRLLLGLGGANTKFIKRLPRPMQSQILDGKKVDLLSTDGTSLKVDARNTTPEHAKQLFANSAIRTISEQREYIDSHKNREVLQEQTPSVIPYEIRRNGVYFPGATLLTKEELRRLVLEIL